MCYYFNFIQLYNKYRELCTKLRFHSIFEIENINEL